MLFRRRLLHSKSCIFDICLVGGGVVGATLFAALSRYPEFRNLRVCMIDDGNRERVLSFGVENSEYTELRTVALSPASENVINNVYGKAKSIQDLGSSFKDHVSLLDTLPICRYSHLTVRDTAKKVMTLPGKGCVIGITALQNSLFKAMEEISHTPNGFSSIGKKIHDHEKDQVREKPPSSQYHDRAVWMNGCVTRVVLPSETTGTATIQYRSNTDRVQCKITPHKRDFMSEREIRAKLVVGCDGIRSLVKTALGNTVVMLDYNQRACVFSVLLDSHAANAERNSICYQNFLPNGSIVGMLPTGNHSANIIYSTNTLEARKLEATDGEAKIIDVLNASLCDLAPRDIPRITGLQKDQSPNPYHGQYKVSFPLAMMKVSKPYGPNVLLVGDAARAVHPLAGQGLNLGLYDAVAFLKGLAETIFVGGDLSKEVGPRYTSNIKCSSYVMEAAIEATRIGLSSNNFWVKHVRSIGMEMFNHSPLLQRSVVALASGKHSNTTLF